MAKRAAKGAEHSHDHGVCVADALGRADEICRSRGVRLTDIRRRVLEIVWSSHAAIGAYDILEKLREKGGRQAPIAVYRALDFLMEQGLVHRLASRNAYIGCDEPAHAHEAQFLICEKCQTVSELSDKRIEEAIRSGAERKRFRVGGHVVEIQGVCASCRRAA
jgi:Fur family transcriptional regulator, zinc uptake regulator